MNTYFLIISLLLITANNCEIVEAVPSINTISERDQIKTQQIENQIRKFQFLDENSTLSVQNQSLKYNPLLLCSDRKNNKQGFTLNYKCAEATLLNNTQNQWLEWNATNEKGQYLIGNQRCEEYIEWTLANNTITGNSKLVIDTTSSFVECNLNYENSGINQNIKLTLTQHFNEHETSEHLTISETSSATTSNNVEVTTVANTDSNTKSSLDINSVFTLFCRISDQSSQIVTTQKLNGTITANATSNSKKSKEIKEWYSKSQNAVSGFSAQSLKSKESVGFRNGLLYLDSQEGKSSEQQFEQLISDNNVNWYFKGDIHKIVSVTSQTNQNINETDVWDLNGTVDLSVNSTFIPNLDQVQQNKEGKEKKEKQIQEPKEPKAPQEPKEPKPEKVKTEAERAEKDALKQQKQLEKQQLKQEKLQVKNDVPTEEKKPQKRRIAEL